MRRCRISALRCWDTSACSTTYSSAWSSHSRISDVTPRLDFVPNTPSPSNKASSTARSMSLIGNLSKTAPRPDAVGKSPAPYGTYLLFAIRLIGSYAASLLEAATSGNAIFSSTGAFGSSWGFSVSASAGAAAAPASPPTVPLSTAIGVSASAGSMLVLAVLLAVSGAATSAEGFSTATSPPLVTSDGTILVVLVSCFIASKPLIAVWMPSMSRHGPMACAVSTRAFHRCARRSSDSDDGSSLALILMDVAGRYPVPCSKATATRGGATSQLTLCSSSPSTTLASCSCPSAGCCCWSSWFGSDDLSSFLNLGPSRRITLPSPKGVVTS
mmetsp:Transcript_23180/g.65649  ORF Transcript_23180/g.65649 Transcript_23180/m.65649 type:complete len:328 (-) Transcript_23180:311-1294(-)